MGRRTLMCASALLAVTMSIVGVGQSPAAKVTVYEGARLIKGDATAWIDPSAFVVEGTHFGEVGRRGDVKVPPGAVRVDLTGKTVIPAMIDAHTQLAGARAALVEQLRRKAYYGVVAVMGTGLDAGDLAFQVRNEIIPNAARLFTAGRGITASQPGGSDIPYSVTNEADARKAVLELAAKEVNLVKIWVDDGKAKYKKLSPELCRAIIDEAHKNGLRVIAHISTLQDAKDLLRAGIDAFSHGVEDQPVDRELITLFRERRNVFYIPTLPDPGIATDLSWLKDTVPPQELEKLQAQAIDRPELTKAFALQHANMNELHYQAQVRLVLGSDSGEPWGHILEMADMGLPGRRGALVPIDVITAGSRNAAELLGLTDQGPIKPGNVASFLVLDGNVGIDLEEMTHIGAVYFRGTELDRAAFRGR